MSELQAMGAERGYFRSLGEQHSAVCIKGSADVLVVGFDSVATARDGSASGIPHSMLLAEVQGWSHLSVISHETSWFRDPSVYDFFDELLDEGFFEEFEQVIFYGVGPSGYAASAFSVVAPGATVIAVAPQATLDARIAPWDDRYVAMRRLNFNDRFGYAPDMIEAAERVILFYDPSHDLDAMHAALFRGPHVLKIPIRNGGQRLGRDLQEMKVVSDVVTQVGKGNLREIDIYRALRRRHDYLPYLRNLLNRAHVEERHLLVGLLCRAVSSRRNAPRFLHHLQLAERHLAYKGKSLPAAHVKRSAADKLPELKV